MPAESEAVAASSSRNMSSAERSSSSNDNENENDENAPLLAERKDEAARTPYPKHVFFILGNEFCERYSYYGMRTILVLYLKYYMLMSDDTSTAIYHAFTVLAYFFPLVGAFIADSWWGKYKTILYLSLVYVCGMILNTMGAIPQLGNLSTHIALSMIGLFIIAVGTGGIKPCVSSFGGDQFTRDQPEYRRRFFSIFYLTINAGSLLSTFISPILREDVQCLGRKDCYSLAFGIPAALMIVATITFVAGTSFYRIKAPEGNVFAEVVKGIKSALVHRCKTPKAERKKAHWMDYALVDTSAKLVRDTKYVLRVSVLLLPLPFFWTLFDQQGSRWTIQATRLNGYIGSIRIKPDQMQVLNPLFIVILIPLVETTLYPALRKCNVNFSPLRRMTLGMLLAGLSFIVAALVQMRMNTTLTPIPETSFEASFRVINAADCPVHITTDIYNNWTQAAGGVHINPGQSTETLSTFVESGKIGKSFTVNYGCNGTSVKKNATVYLGKKSTWNMVISNPGGSLRDDVFKGITKKSNDGGAVIRIFNAMNYSVNVVGIGKTNRSVAQNNISEKWDVDQNSYTIKIYNNQTSKLIATHKYRFSTGGDYTVLVWNKPTNTTSSIAPAIKLFVDVSPNVVSLFWIVPQYFIITLGEIFLSVTGIEFAYSQAPTSMKSVLSSFWLLTDSLGNVITLIIAEAKLVSNQAQEYFLFAGLIGAATIAFVILAVRYEYVDEEEILKTENDPLSLRPNEEESDVDGVPTSSS